MSYLCTKLLVPSIGSMIHVGLSVNTHFSPPDTVSSPMNLCKTKLLNLSCCIEWRVCNTMANLRFRVSTYTIAITIHELLGFPGFAWLLEFPRVTWLLGFPGVTWPRLMTLSSLWRIGVHFPVKLPLEILRVDCARSHTLNKVKRCELWKYRLLFKVTAAMACSRDMCVMHNA